MIPCECPPHPAWNWYLFLDLHRLPTWCKHLSHTEFPKGFRTELLWSNPGGRALYSLWNAFLKGFSPYHSIKASFILVVRPTNSHDNHMPCLPRAHLLDLVSLVNVFQFRGLFIGTLPSPDLQIAKSSGQVSLILSWFFSSVNKDNQCLSLVRPLLLASRKLDSLVSPSTLLVLHPCLI